MAICANQGRMYMGTARQCMEARDAVRQQCSHLLLLCGCREDKAPAAASGKQIDRRSALQKDESLPVRRMAANRKAYAPVFRWLLLM